MSKPKERNPKKSVKIVGVAGLLVILVAAFGVFYSTPIVQQSNAQVYDQNQAGLIEIPSKELPYEMKYRTGIPVLRAYEVLEPAKQLYFHPVKQGESEYLWRAVGSGATFMSDKEMEEFFTTFSEKGYRFAMETAEGTKFYRIRYSEPPISTDTHWVKIFVYDDQKQDAKPLTESDRRNLSFAIEKSFRWVPVDEHAAQSIKNLLDTEGQIFQTMTEEGDRSVRVMYLGPLSEELQRPEFQAMYPEAGQ